ncbi:MucR family transcriptional regulator [Cognatishimia sp. WU-CL00825]|uniref:MucR family transcriptional regulator n=1 Tax=Cognatishimia sp. WU-CL00825 TaxID=3127658 RepID=UPI003104DDFE
MPIKEHMDSYKNDPKDNVATIVAAYAQRSDVSIDDIMALTKQLLPVFQTQTAVITEAPITIASKPAMAPAIPLENAVTDDKVFCLCCGRGFTMLKRHLNAEHGLSEDEYRQVFGLPESMPLVAPNYSERKAAYAKQVGLGKYSRDADLPDAPHAG